MENHQSRNRSRQLRSIFFSSCASSFDLVQQLCRGSTDLNSVHHTQWTFNGTRNVNNKEINSPLEKCQMNCRHNLFSICYINILLFFLHNLIKADSRLAPFSPVFAFCIFIISIFCDSYIYLSLSSLVSYKDVGITTHIYIALCGMFFVWTLKNASERIALHWMDLSQYSGNGCGGQHLFKSRA